MERKKQSLSTTASIRDFLLDLIFPTTCLGCKKFSQTNICLLCRETIKLQNGFSCAFCRAPVVNGMTCPFCRRDHDLNQLIVALSYDQPLVKNSIKAFKYSFVQSLGKELAPLMAIYLERVLKNNAIKLENVVLVPIPLAATRLRWRGYNQSEILAREIGHYFQLPVLEGLLSRKKNTKPQVDIKNRNERIENVKDAFVCHQPAVVRGRNIILIDDLSTTGSTLEQCATVLKTTGANKISGFVLARN